MTTFTEMLQGCWDEHKFVCVGLDSDMKSPKFPAEVAIHPWVKQFDYLDNDQRDQLSFNCWIIDTTHDLVCAFKPNLAFYKKDKGKQVLYLTILYIHHVAEGVPVILDAKQADIGNTNDGYVEEDFDWYDADAVTVNPFLGMEAMRPFLDCSDRGIIVLVRTSNEGAGEFQDLSTGATGRPLFLQVAENVSTHWNYNGNCAVVVGATYPREMKEVRKTVGDMPILIPGIGAQSGDLEKTVLAGRNSRNQGMIINSSRGIIFASTTVKEEGSDKLKYTPDQFAEAARAETQKLHDAINAVLDAA